MSVDLEKFRELLAAFDDEAVLEMAPAAIAEIEYLRAEIARLRLTDEEREAVRAAAKDYEDSAALCYEQVRHTEAAKRMKQAVVIRGLLERLGGKK